MRKVTYGVNITADGYCDHTTVIADDELHSYAADTLRPVDTILFGRKTYQLFESYWPVVASEASETDAINEFARQIDSKEKIVLSHILHEVKWKNSTISPASPEEELQKLKDRPGGGISIAGLSIASRLAHLGLIDEYHFLVQPMIAGTGPRIDFIGTRKNLRLVGSKTFHSGVIALHYEKF